MAWHPNKALAKLIKQWKQRFPRAVVGTIGDENHDPWSDHSVDPDGTVDAGDFMPGHGVGATELDSLAETLRMNRDPRIKYVIRRDRIFAGNDGPKPWEWRDYDGEYHGHTHVSTREANEDDGSDWVLTRKKWKMDISLNGLSLPTVKMGDDDKVTDGYNYVTRIQSLLNYVQSRNVTVDGDYGPETVAAVANLPTPGNGKSVGLAEWTILLGLVKVGK